MKINTRFLKVYTRRGRRITIEFGLPHIYKVGFQLACGSNVRVWRYKGGFDYASKQWDF